MLGCFENFPIDANDVFGKVIAPRAVAALCRKVRRDIGLL
jgi:hypothetical protein